MAKSKIAWTERVWNPVTGCTEISAGCKNCYAARMSKRLAGRAGYTVDNPFKVTLHPDRLEQPLRWKKPSRIFVCSMADLFHGDVPMGYISRVFSIVRRCPQHTFLFLTKRPARMRDAVDLFVSDADLPNLWLGVTAENQDAADERIPLLLATPAAKRFVSIEPMLGAVDLKMGNCSHCQKRGNQFHLTHSCEVCGRVGGKNLDWVICGGESGPGARPMHPAWARSLRDQCEEAGVPFFFKQWGEWAPDCFCQTPQPCKATPRPTPGRRGRMFRCGKARAGHLLDGKEHREFPI